MVEKKGTDDYDFSKSTKSYAPTTEQRVVYIINGALVSILPLYLYLSVFGIDYHTYAPVLAVLTLVSAVVVSMSYHHVALLMKNKLLSLRGNVKPQRSGKGEEGATKVAVVQARRALQTNVITHESIAYSILFNNTIFLLSVMVLAFYVFPGTASGLYLFVYDDGGLA